MHTELLQAATAASLAIGRAEERLERSLHRAILLPRVRMLEAESLGLIEGVAVLHDHLAALFGDSPAAIRQWPFAFARVVGRPFPPAGAGPAAATGLPGTEAVMAWLCEEAACAAPVSLADLRWLDRTLARLWPDAAAPGALVPLLVGADLAIAWQAGLPAGVLGMVLADRVAQPDLALSSGGIAAMGIMLEGVRWSRLVASGNAPGLDRTAREAHWHRCRLAWLRALARGAEEVLRLDDAIAAWQRAVDASCRTRRRISGLQSLCQHMAVRPSTSVAQAAVALKISRQSAARLVSQAQAEGLIREITHGAYLRRYCATA